MPSGGELFLGTISLDADRVVVGAPDAMFGDLEFVGAAYVFRRAGSSWLEEARLTASDAREGDLFGWASAISEDYIVIGARGCDDAYPADTRFDSGAAYVFRRDYNGTPGDPTDDSWIEASKLIASDGAFQDHFGEVVSITENFVTVGAASLTWPGRGYLFRRARTRP